MRRLNVEFNEMQASSLQRVAGALNETQVAVIRMGLRLVGRAVEENRRGNHLAVVGPDGRVVELDGEWSQVRPVTA